MAHYQYMKVKIITVYLFDKKYGIQLIKDTLKIKDILKVMHD